MAYSYLGRDLDAWRNAGRSKLDEQSIRANRYTRYYDGEPIGLHLEGRQRDVFRRLLKESRANWCELIVNAVAERLYVTGFRFADDRVAELAWLVWQANEMDADAEMVQTDALVCGQSFVSVWPNDDSPVGVVIYPEHPTEVCCFYQPPDRRNAVAAFKRVEDEFHTTTEVLVTNDAVAMWVGNAAVTVQPNELGSVPYEQIVPAPRTLGPGRSELHSAIPFQDRINTGVYNRLLAEDFGAFRQVTATGVALLRTEEGGYEAPFDVGADRLLVSENADARFGAIPESTLSGYLAAEEKDVQHLAAISQTPPHYLLGQIANLSASALKTAETGLVAKVRRRAQHIGEGWERVLRRALSYVGSPGSIDFEAETVWADFESRSEGETVDALVKMRSLGVPLEVLWERWGASPQDVEHWRELAAAEPPAPEPTPAPEPIPTSTGGTA